MPRGVFSTVAHRIAALQGEVHPLHIGDTWLEPAAGCCNDDLDTRATPGLHRYAPPMGETDLLDAIVDRRGVARSRVIVTAGATGGLSAALGAVLAPGDEVLLLAPYWPLIRGIVQSQRGVPVDVPFFVGPDGGPGPLDGDDVEAVLDARRTERTVALYLNSPNNPTGRVLPAGVLDRIVAWARRHDLWLLSDEVYEDYVFAPGLRHESLADRAPERTFAAWSFSKAYGMAGNRVGYLVAPEEGELVQEVRKVAMHAYYAAPKGPQLTAARALRHGGEWLSGARDAYARAGAAAAARLGVPEAQGGTFLFLDASPVLDERGMQGLLERCIDRNLLVAPGASFGEDYAHFVRVCFTSAPPAQVARAVDVLAEILGR
ncbi:MAG: pyridoxal phosphate-dependent aminotransferase [Alphaproteobacteria bacterium]|nr:pyridoxal phosphate-dependent aminotransferase [Alphaproteobacteria bacterium]